MSHFRRPSDYKEEIQDLIKRRDQADRHRRRTQTLEPLPSLDKKDKS